MTSFLRKTELPPDHNTIWYTTPLSAANLHPPPHPQPQSQPQHQPQHQPQPQPHPHSHPPSPPPPPPPQELLTGKEGAASVVFISSYLTLCMSITIWLLMSLCCKCGGTLQYEINPWKSLNGAISRILNGPGTKSKLFKRPETFWPLKWHER